MIISVYSVKNLHALFSKHGASDAKKTKKNEHCSDKRTLMAQAGEAEG